MRKSKIVLCFLLLISSIQAQDSLKLEWAKEISTPYTIYDYPGDIVLDTQNNIYITGNTGVGFGPDKIVTIKYTPAGDEEWIKYDYGIDSSYAEGVRIKMDKYQNVYVSGITNTDSSSSDYYLIKYSSDGEETRKTNFDGGWEDHSGNIVLTEEGNGAMTGFGLKGGQQRCLTVRFNSGGEEVWQKWYRYNEISTNSGSDIIMDTNSNVYVIGAIDQSPETRSFLIKYNQDGEIDWVKNREGVFGYKLILDRTNNLYAFYSVGKNITLAKYSENGEELWNAIYPDSSLGFTTQEGILTDKDDNIYIAALALYIGSFILKFNNEGVFEWISAESLDGVIKAIDIDKNNNIYAAAPSSVSKSIIVAKYDSLGNIKQKLNFSTGDDNYYFVKNALLDGNNNFYVFGYKAPDGYQRTMILLKYKLDPITGIEEKPEEISKEFTLYQNYPNPFNPTTKISLSVPTSANVAVKVFDLLGEEVQTLIHKNLSPGNYDVEFNASNLPSGVYFYRLTAGSFVETKKMMMIR